MRVAVLGVSHWHLELFLPTLLGEPDVRVVGVHDPDPERARAVGERVGCPWWTDEQRLLDELAPDFVLAFGAHDEMAASAHRLLDRGVPFAMEKPCGLDAGQVHGLADRAARLGAFAAVPFVWRQSELLGAMRARFADAEIDYLSFRWIAGPPSRYPESGCGWMLDPARSGGGCTVNLSVHMIDLARVLLGPEVEVVAATMSNAAYGLPVEDHSLVTLRAADRTLHVETGYLYPAPHLRYDMRFSVKARRHYLIATDEDTVEVIGPDGPETVRAKTTNVPHYPVFVRDVLRRVRAGEPPLAALDDMAAAMDLVEQAYLMGGLGR